MVLEPQKHPGRLESPGQNGAVRVSPNSLTKPPTANRIRSKSVCGRVTSGIIRIVLGERQRPTNGQLVRVRTVPRLELKYSLSDAWLRSEYLRWHYFAESTESSLEPKIGESFGYASPQM